MPMLDMGYLLLAVEGRTWKPETGTILGSALFGGLEYSFDPLQAA